MVAENHLKLKAAFIAGRLDASLTKDHGRLPSQEQRHMEMLLSMVLGDADREELTKLCQVLFQKESPGTTLDLMVRTAEQGELAAAATVRRSGNGSGGDRR